MKKIFIILLVLPLCCPFLYSQQIRVTVNASGNPIAGATVRLLDLDRSSHTNSHGQAVFLSVPEGRYRIFVRVIGYAPATDTIQVDGPFAEATFELNESAIGIEEIVVSASPYARTADDQYQSAESKSTVDLHDSPGASFAEKISDLPGVTVRGNGSAPSRPYFADFRITAC